MPCPPTGDRRVHRVITGASNTTAQLRASHVREAIIVSRKLVAMKGAPNDQPVKQPTDNNLRHKNAWSRPAAVSANQRKSTVQKAANKGWGKGPQAQPPMRHWAVEKRPRWVSATRGRHQIPVSNAADTGGARTKRGTRKQCGARRKRNRGDGGRSVQGWPPRRKRAGTALLPPLGVRGIAATASFFCLPAASMAPACHGWAV